MKNESQFLTGDTNELVKKHAETEITEVKIEKELKTKMIQWVREAHPAADNFMDFKVGERDGHVFIGFKCNIHGQEKVSVIEMRGKGDFNCCYEDEYLEEKEKMEDEN